MTHKELLIAAQDLHFEEVQKRTAAETRILQLEAKITDLTTAMKALEAEIVRLNEIILELNEKLEDEGLDGVVDEPPYLLRETFQEPLDPDRFIFLCHDPAKNFIWIEPGTLEVAFFAGRTTGTAVSSVSGKVERSEVEWRKIGEPPSSRVPQSIPVGEEYEIAIDFTIPSGYSPAVSSAPNEKRNLFQLWESSDVKPFAVELLMPSLEPWDGKTNVLRIVAGGAVRWTRPVAPGNRYRLVMFVKLASDSSGRLEVEGIGEPAVYTGPTTGGDSAFMVPHFGLYLPGSGNDPVGGRTGIRFHEVSIR